MAGDAHVLPASLLSGTRAGSPEEKNSGTVKINHDDIKHDAAIKYFAKPKSKRHKADTGKSSQRSEGSHQLRHLWSQVQQKDTRQKDTWETLRFSSTYGTDVAKL